MALKQPSGGETTPREIKVLLLNISGGKEEDAASAQARENSSSPKEEGKQYAVYVFLHHPSEVKSKGEIVVSAKGRGAAARHALVTEIVREVNPDVLLLQETKTKILINDIIKVGVDNGRDYKQVAPSSKEGAREDSWTEAKVLYDNEKLKENYPQQQQQTLASEQTQESTGEAQPKRKGKLEMQRENHLFSEAVDATTAPEDTITLRRGKSNPIGQVVKERTSWVSLKLNGDNQHIIFLSFHNYNSRNPIHSSAEGAKVFCKAMAAMGERKKGEEQLYVVGGGDFNWDIEEIQWQDQKSVPPIVVKEEELKATGGEENLLGEGIHIPYYEMTKRRKDKGKRKIDFFVTKPKLELDYQKPLIQPYNIRPLGRKLQGMKIKGSRATYEFTADELTSDDVIDHDPIVYTLTLPTAT